MGNEYVLISKEDLGQMINTLKNIDVRGYESMNRLVATVVFLENIFIQGNGKPQVVATATKGERIKKYSLKRRDNPWLTLRSAAS